MYSYCRIRSIFRKGDIDFDQYQISGVSVDQPAERALVLHLLRFAETVQAVGESLEPHRLCNYLYDLATRYHQFFEQCPVLKSEGELREQRLGLCKYTALVLERGLSLLGIEIVERM
jgi:arginyl-tRNA synthetase